MVTFVVVVGVAILIGWGLQKFTDMRNKTDQRDPNPHGNDDPSGMYF